LFLNCSLSSIPFSYLSLPVGADAKKLSTWEPVLEKINAKLNSWGNN
jgi:hypothetical protein